MKPIISEIMLQDYGWRARLWIYPKTGGKVADRRWGEREQDRNAADPNMKGEMLKCYKKSQIFDVI